jgi:hypothetical protein
LLLSFLFRKFAHIKKSSSGFMLVGPPDDDCKRLPRGLAFVCRLWAYRNSRDKSRTFFLENQIFLEEKYKKFLRLLLIR